MAAARCARGKRISIHNQSSVRYPLRYGRCHPGFFGLAGAAGGVFEAMD